MPSVQVITSKTFFSEAQPTNKCLEILKSENKKLNITIVNQNIKIQEMINHNNLLQFEISKVIRIFLKIFN